MQRGEVTLFCLLLMFSILPMTRLKPASASSPSVKLNSTTTQLGPENAVGTRFTVSLYICDVENLYAFSIQVEWNVDYFRHIPPIRFPFLRPPYVIIPPIPPVPVDPLAELTNASAWIFFDFMLMQSQPFSGTLEVALFTFEVTDQPGQPENATFSMTITSSILADTSGVPIPHTDEDLSIPLYGRNPFNIKIEEVNHPQAVCYGFPIYIEVLIINDGDHTLTFNLTLTINGTVTRISHVEMEGGWTVLILYFLDSTKYRLGNLTVDATAQLLNGDSNATDNTYDAGSLTVTIIGDVNGDLSVNVSDVVAITSIYGSKQGDPQHRAASDLNHDGQISILDVTTCTSYYGAKYP